jgi:hypothetical protein
VEESKVRVAIPYKSKPVDIKKPEPPPQRQDDDDSDDEVLDVQ